MIGIKKCQQQKLMSHHSIFRKIEMIFETINYFKIKILQTSCQFYKQKYFLRVIDELQTQCTDPNEYLISHLCYF